MATDMSTASKIERVSGRAIGVRGDDIDTDRIIPARFLKTITFDGLGDHVFEDDRLEAKGRGLVHPFDEPTHQGARILIAQSNFGCGSSREHAPQGLLRWGIKAVVAESFSEIFRGNSSVLGVPCFTADKSAIEALQTLIETSPDTLVEARVDSGIITAGSLRVQAQLPSGVREAFVTDRWNPTSMLLDDYDQVKHTASKLPYVSGF